MIIPSSLFRQARFVAFLLIISFLTSCTTLQLKPLPEPPPSAKLRVFFDAFTIDERQTGKPAPARPPAFFEHSTADFEADQKRIVVQFLEQTDIYEVVQEKDVHEVLGDQWLRFSMLEQNGFSQAREIARALHAEYALFVARILSNEMHGAQGRSIKVVLVNTETGKQYKAVRRLTTFNTFSPGQWKALIRDAYRDLFAQSKEDMLRVALGKGDRMAAQVQPPSTMRLQQEQKASLAPNQRSEPRGSQDALTALTAEPSSRSGTKLVVYDIEASEQYRPVALILTEALREELFRLNRFILVNRENLEQILKEMALQQTGIIDEKDAVKTGKGLAASQVVTGRLGQLGQTYVLQTKRIDVETFATLSLASTRFVRGKEDEVFSRLPALAKSLAGMP